MKNYHVAKRALTHYLENDVADALITSTLIPEGLIFEIDRDGSWYFTKKDGPANLYLTPFWQDVNGIAIALRNYDTGESPTFDDMPFNLTFDIETDVKAYMAAVKPYLDRFASGDFPPWRTEELVESIDRYFRGELHAPDATTAARYFKELCRRIK